MKFSQYVFSFLMGYFIYSMIEIINRGYTHWTMSLTGGFILALLYSINSSGGMTLLKSCNEKIDTVEKKILIMNGDGGLDEF